MSTYGDMQSRIADEIARSDLTTQIQMAILSAIEYYKDDKFWFNEGEATINTTAGLDHDAMPVTFGELDVVTVTVPGSDRYKVETTTYEWIRDNATQSSLVGRPEFYAFFEEDVWYYPIPDAVYPIIFSGLIYLSTLTGPNSTNAWTNEAEQLIRCRAKWDIYYNITRNDKEAQKMEVAEMKMWSKLMKKTTQKVASGRLQPIRF